jgi:hypothetical protein
VEWNAVWNAEYMFMLQLYCVPLATGLRYDNQMLRRKFKENWGMRRGKSEEKDIYYGALCA